MSSVVDTTPFYKKLAFNLVSLSILGVILYLGQGILIPLFSPFCFRYYSCPPTAFSGEMKINRNFSILIPMFFSLLVIFTIVYFLSASGVRIFLDDSDKIQGALNGLYWSLQHWVKSEFGLRSQNQNQVIRDTGQKMDAAAS